MTGSAAPRPPLLLVDASLYVFRAWHSMPDEFHDADGWPTNAVRGFAGFLAELLQRERPRHIVVAFDDALDSCFRNAIYPPYKANRPPAPDTLKRQFAYCRALCTVMGLPVLGHREYEADDLIGTALHQARAYGHRGVIVSADKDLSQLLQAGDEQWDFARGMRWGRDGVEARHGVRRADRRLPGAGGRQHRQHPRRAGRGGAHRGRCWRTSAVWTRCSNAWTKCPTCACAARRGGQRLREHREERCCTGAWQRSPAMRRSRARRHRSRAPTPTPRHCRSCVRRSPSPADPAPPARSMRPALRRRGRRGAGMSGGGRDDPQILHEGKWLRLVKRGRWEWCERTHSAHGLAVLVVAVTPDDEVLFVEQYREALGAPAIEMPAGLIGDDHDDDTIEQAARRELIEETGWEPGAIDVLLAGPTTAGMSNGGSCSCAHATCARSAKAAAWAGRTSSSTRCRGPTCPAG